MEFRTNNDSIYLNVLVKTVLRLILGIIVCKIDSIFVYKNEYSSSFRGQSSY